MQLDVWNNPIVVSAMRQKYRRGSPRLMLSAYVAAMLCIGALLNHYSTYPQNPSAAARYPFASTYLFVMLAVQFVLSGGIAMFGTAKSMNAEVVNQTLDFQRIVSLSPRTILVGKMLGEPASSYLLAVATIPLAVLCWALSGASVVTILMFYFNLATWTLMCASFGLIHPLTPAANKAGQRRTSVGGIFFLLVFVIPNVIGSGLASLDVPGLGEVIQLLTPLGWFMAYAAGGISSSSDAVMSSPAAWEAAISLWGASVPSLVAAPIAQLLLTWLILSAMSRRLKNPNDAPLTKLHAYAVLAVLDILLAGICYAHWLDGEGSIRLIYCFCLVHIIFCMALLFAMSPGKTAVSSWVWRHCGSRPSVRDRLIGDRFENTVAGLVMAAMGVVAVYLGVVAPTTIQAAASQQANPLAQSVENAAPLPLPIGSGQEIISLFQFAEITAAMIAMVAASAIVHQVISIVVSKSGNMLFVFFLFGANAITPSIAGLIQAWYGPREEMLGLVQGLISLSPIGYYGSNIAQLSGIYINGWLPIVVYACVAALGYAYIAHWLRIKDVVVRKKLTSMGVLSSPT